MIAILLALVLIYLLCRTSRIKGRVQLALAFILGLVLMPFLLQLITLHFGLFGFWSFILAAGILAIFLFSQNKARKNDA